MSWLEFSDYQFDAISKMKNGCILCGGVGTGKSRTSLAYYYEQQKGNVKSEKYVNMTNPKDLYIITTAMKRDRLEWEGELIPFGMYDGTSLYSHKIVIDSWYNIKKYKNVYNAFFIFDEQKLVGSGVWVKTFLNIARKNRWVLLTATPGDTWMDYIPVFIANGFYKNRTEFKDEHVRYHPRTPFPMVKGYLNTRKLNMFRNQIVIRMKNENDIKSIPIHIHSEYNRQKYLNIGKTRWNPYKDKPIESASELCYLWRRVVNEDISKTQELLKITKEHNKVIVFYNFNYELDILKNLNYPKEFKIAEWNGHIHASIPKSNKWIYLVQYTAGCEGWNCIETNVVVFYSANYSYKVMVQAAGRINRMNTPFKELFYYHINSNSKIDLAIKKAIKEKKNFNESLYLKGV